MSDREGLFEGNDPFEIARVWLAEASETEINDPNAIALATVDPEGMPNSRMVLLKEIEDAAFVFYTNYESTKAQEIEASGTASFVMHWKSLRRQIRAVEIVSITPPEREDTPVLSDLAQLDDEEISNTPLEPARVKWFDKAKGFGFANVFGRDEDVFLHVEVLRQSGLSDVQSGEALAMRVIEGKRGRMAVDVLAWEAASTYVDYID
eukprot:g18241.t1